MRYVLEGSVRKAGDRLRVTGQLIDATSGNHIWAERYDRLTAEIFAVQDEITASVVAAIEPQLSDASIQAGAPTQPALVPNPAVLQPNSVIPAGVNTGFFPVSRIPLPAHDSSENAVLSHTLYL